MQYQTIVLGLLEQRHPLHSRLRQLRMLLPAMAAYALELKARHQDWKEQLAKTRPDSDPAQIASEALELAICELEGCLPPASPLGESEALSLDQAMAFIRRHTPPA
jgi:hypothetical protein